jgi:hypothetical protein
MNQGILKSVPYPHLLFGKSLNRAWRCVHSATGIKIQGYRWGRDYTVLLIDKDSKVWRWSGDLDTEDKGNINEKTELQVDMLVINCSGTTQDAF